MRSNGNNLTALAIVAFLCGVLIDLTLVNVAARGAEVPLAKSDPPSPPVAFLTQTTFDEYGNIRLNDEKARLDNFAIALQNEPGARGYIVGYDERSCRRRGAASRRIARARSYMVNERGVPASRVVRLYGGRREDFTIVLFIVPAGGERPRPTPTLSRCR